MHFTIDVKSYNISIEKGKGLYILSSYRSEPGKSIPKSVLVCAKP